MRGAIFFDSRKKGVSQVLISMGIGASSHYMPVTIPTTVHTSPLLTLPVSEDMDTIKTMFIPLMNEDRMKHIDYKTFNSIQQVNNSETELRYNFLQSKVAEAVSEYFTLETRATKTFQLQKVSIFVWSAIV
jgi:hypothetical protein